MEKHLKRSDIFRENEKFYINRSDENEEYMGVMHDHDFIEICYVISGNGLHVLGNDKYETGSGDLYVINSNFMHGFFPLADKKKPPLVYNCIFTPDFIDSRLFGNSDFKEVTSSIFFQDVVPDSIEAKPYFSFKETQYSEIGEIFEKMHREYRITQKGYSDLIRAYIIELLVKIFRFINEPNDYFNFFQNAPEKHRRIIEKSISFMKKYYSEELTL